MAGITDTYTYNAFGVTTATGPNPNRFRYTGREWDSETGLYYYRARYYDPSVGRFASEDPIQFRGDVNFYRYVRNSPVVSTDPSGLFPTWWHRKHTYEIAFRVFGSKCADKAKTIADANASMDEYHGWDWIKDKFGQGEGWRVGGPHFQQLEMVEGRLSNAITTCNPTSFGQALHSLQDYFAHPLAWWDPALHWFSTIGFDYGAVVNSDTAEAALGYTEHYIREYKEKCLKCCE